MLVFKKDPSYVLVRKNHKETEPFSFALEISKGQWPDHIAFSLSHGHNCLESTSYPLIATEQSRFTMNLYFPDHPGGRLSAIPSPFFTSQSINQGISPTTAHSSSVWVSSHITTHSKLHRPKQEWQSGMFMYRNEMQDEKQSNSEVLFVDVNVCVYVCLFNITVFEVQDDVIDVAHAGQMSLDMICDCWPPPSAHPLVLLSL